MKAILDVILQQLGGGTLGEVGKKLGINEATAQKAVAAAVPLILSALAKNASKPDGAQALHQALSKDHNGSILDDVMGLLGNVAGANGAGILKHVLGTQRPVVEKGLASGIGLDSAKTGQLLEMVAPLVMGAIGKTQQQEHLDVNGLAQFLGGQRQMAQQSQPDIMGIVGGLIDSNKDGNVLDDLGRLAGKLFGGGR